jgi:hypothetical protein
MRTAKAAHAPIAEFYPLICHPRVGIAEKENERLRAFGLPELLGRGDGRALTLGRKSDLEARGFARVNIDAA